MGTAAMRIVRFRHEGGINYGALSEDGETAKIIEGDIFGEHRVTSIEASIVDSKYYQLLAPVAPSNILCIGLNYKRHAEECGMKFPEYPVLFFKNSSAACAHGDNIVIPAVSWPEEMDYECELAVVIGKPCKNVTKERALVRNNTSYLLEHPPIKVNSIFSNRSIVYLISPLQDYVLGYMCANDVSARKWQMNGGGGQWNRGKSFDTFCPLGPCLVTSDEIPDPNALKIRTVLNDKVMQDWSTDDMIFNVPEIIEFLSQGTTLAPGTVILTGTPQGVGFAMKPPVVLQEGDVVTIDIEKIGQLTNTVVRE